MKRIISAVLALIMTCLVSVTAFAADTADGGNTSGRIVISPSATASERFAAGRLCDRLNTVFGGYSVVRAEEAEPGDIAVGNTPFSTVDFGDRKGGSYVIRSEDGYTALNGNGMDGLINGVYEFLSRFCGYEVYERDVIRYTDEKYLTLPENINIEYEPYFEYRKVDTVSAYDWEYCHANSINTTRQFANEEGGIVDYISSFGHTLSTQFCSRDRYFAEHPEYFALHDGVRTPNQLCLTNEDTIRIVTEEVLALLRQRHDPSMDLQIVSLTQDDNEDYCSCEKCAAIDKANGSHAGAMLTLVNRVADRVKAEGYGNVAIDTFAYQWTRTVPTQIKPRDNVIVRLCSIECCFAHPFCDTSCKENAAFMKDLEGWGKICSRLYIWDYVNNYSETFLPFPDFEVLQKNIQTCYENGAKGYYAEGNYYMNLCDSEFPELRTYLISKLMENPYRTDYYTLMDNYLAAVYGPGGKYLREYIDTTCALAAKHSKLRNDARLHVRQQPKDCLPGITVKQVKHFDSLWAKAKEEAQTGEQRQRVEKSSLSWEYWKCCRHRGKYTLLQSPYKYMKSHVSLLEEIESFGNTSVGEGAIKYLRKNPCRVLFFAPVKWESKYDGKFFDKLDAFAKRLYELMGGEYNFEY